MAVFPQLLGDGQDRWNVITRMGIIGGQEGVVIVQFTYRGAIGPSGPLGMKSLVVGKPEDCCTIDSGVGDGLRPGADDRMTVDGGDGDRCIIDDPVYHHVRDVGVDTNRVRRNVGNLPGQLILFADWCFRGKDFDWMILQCFETFILIERRGQARNARFGNYWQVAEPL